MSGLGRRAGSIVIGHALGYAPLAVLLEHDPAAILPSGAVLVVPVYGIGLTLLWLAWRTGIAVGDLAAILAGRRARQRRARLLDGYQIGTWPAVNQTS